MGVDLYPHQKEAVKKMKNGCILTGGVGTGKTITALSYWYFVIGRGIPHWEGYTPKPMSNPMDVYVFTTARKRDDLDWEEEALNFRVGTTPNPEGVKIKVDSWNNIANYIDLKGAFVIFDEQRLVGKGAWVKSFLKIAQNNKWVILSATPGDVWMDYCPVFIANGFYKNRSEFVERHVVYSPYTTFPKISKYIDTGRLEKLRRSIIVDMPYHRSTKRKINNFLVDYNELIFDKVVKERWNPYENAPIKNAPELFSVMRKVVNSDVSRIGAVMELLEKHPKLIVFYNFDYELEMLRTLKTTMNYEVAEWNGHKHEPVPKTDKWLYLVQYAAGNEAWNCITTDAMAFFSQNYSYKVFMQAQGRIDRLNTPYTDLHYYVLRSDSMIDKAIRKALIEKKDFNEKSLRLG